ncbi:MAG TPA: sulfite exporter TauE/SafE family protein [bacterium]|nr:sulfite exporter TauE/SafE family protein [bacterium]
MHNHHHEDHQCSACAAPTLQPANLWLSGVIGFSLALFFAGLDIFFASWFEDGSSKWMFIIPLYAFLGFAAGLTCCGALIASLLLSLSKHWQEHQQGKSLLRPYLIFIIGRLLAFAVLGFVLGYLGKNVLTVPWLGNVVLWALSALMIVLALQLLGVGAFKNFHVPGCYHWSNSLQRGRNIYSGFLGMLTVLLPCAITLFVSERVIVNANPWEGVLIMLIFVMGGILPLLALIFFSAKFARKSDYFLKISGFFILFTVLYNILESLGGL